VEWADKGINLLPPESLIIEISYLDDSKRSLHCIPGSRRYRELLAELGKPLKKRTPKSD
jgi:tRNA A37 threonylcarbamoyladenosine biosynthesis protein TsaE